MGRATICALVTGAGTLLFLCDAAAAAATGPVSILAPATIAVDPGAAKPTTLTLLNSSKAPVTVRFTLALDKRGGQTSVKPKQTTIEAFGVKRVAVTISSKKQSLTTSGDLVVTPIAPSTSPSTAAAIAPSAAVALAIKPSVDESRAAWLLLGLSLAAAVAIVLRCWQRLPGRWRLLLREMGPVGWDFSTSWASNITVVGAILGTVLSAGVLPEDTHYVSKNGYTILSLLFGIVVIAAPFVYTATRRATIVRGKPPAFKGFVASFLVACTITLWGVLGELATVGLVFREIELAGSFPPSIVKLLYALLAVGAILVWVYTVGTIDAVAESQGYPPRRPPKAGRRTVRARGSRKAITGSLPEEKQPAAPPPETLDDQPGWNVL